MCLFKKKKIQTYLDGLGDSKTAFDLILCDYLDGSLKEKIQELGLTKIEIIVNCHANDFLLGAQAKYKSRYIDMQIYQGEFSLSHDVDEPDDDIFYPLESREQFYQTLANLIKTIEKNGL